MLKGTATMLLGGPGSGKTYSLASFVEAGIELFCIFTEPGGEESLLKAVHDRKLDVSKVHWCYIPTAAPTFESMIKSAETIGMLSYAALTDIKAGVEKGNYQQFLHLLRALANFKCERTGETYGPVDSWDASRAIVVDSLSGVNIMAMDMVVGSKPVKHQGEWGVAMDAEERLVNKLCADIRAFFVLTAHIEREMNEATGIPQLMAGALGRKLAPKMPRFFSDVVLAYREGANFYWSTVAMNVDLKARTLPLQDKLAPSFVPVVNAWRKRSETAQTTPQASVAPASTIPGSDAGGGTGSAAAPGPALPLNTVPNAGGGPVPGQSNV